MENIIQKAIGKALALHAGQVRKGDGSPYIVHPLEVGFIVSRYTNNNGLIAAAILHDTVEDCDYKLEDLKSEFGTEVASIVEAMTVNESIEDWEARKIENIERIRNTEDAPFIKAADCLANMRALVAALRTDGNIVWNRFNATKALKLSYFRSVLTCARGIMPPEMIESYVDALKDIEHSEIFEHSAIGFVSTALA